MKPKQSYYLPIMIAITMMIAPKAYAMGDIQSANQIMDNTARNAIDSKRVVKENASYEVPNKLSGKITGQITKDVIQLDDNLDIFPGNKKINLTVEDIDVADVLKIIAEESKVNIVLDPSVKGTINSDLKNVSIKDAFKLIMATQELEARVENGAVFVASRGAMAKKGLSRKYIKTFKLNNANAVEVAQILEASIFNKGYNVGDATQSSAQAAPQSSSQPAQQDSQAQGQPAQQAQAAVSEESSAGQSILSKDKIIKGKIEEIEPGIGFGQAKMLASEIQIQNKKSVTKAITISNNDGGAIVIPDTRTNSILVSGLQQDIYLAQQAIESLDKPLDQVAIEVSLIEINKEDIKNLGTKWDGTKSKIGGGFNDAAGNVLNGLTGDGNQSYWIYDSAQTGAGAFDVRLNTLIQNKKAKILANPTITALDGSESLIKITDQVVSKMEIYVTQNTATYNVTMADVGIVLNILPKIGSDGYVTMRVRPSITSPLQERTVGNSGGFVTPISTREVIIQDTRVKSGGTLAIAGLVKDNQQETVGKLPGISSLPIIGHIFTSKESKNIKTELVILITPKILDDRAARL